MKKLIAALALIALCQTAHAQVPGLAGPNQVLAGPTSGGTSQPAVSRALITQDLPNPLTLQQIINLNTTALPAATTGTLLEAGNADTVNSLYELSAFGAFTEVNGRRANGTNASPTTLVTTNLITSFSGSGYDGTGWSAAASGFNIYAEGTWSNTSHPSEDCLITTPTSSIVSATGLCQHQDKGVTLGTPTGGDEGANTINAAGAIYVNGVQVAAFPVATRAGDVIYWNGSAWTNFGGNTSGTQCYGENAVGAPQWTACSGGGGSSPGGSNGQIQYNASSSFGGLSFFTTNGSSTVTFAADNGNLILNDPSPNNDIGLLFQSSATPYWLVDSGAAATSHALRIYDEISGQTVVSIASGSTDVVTLGSLSNVTSTAQATTQIYKSETISGIDTEGAQNAALQVLVEGNNTTHTGGGAPITQSNGIRSQVVQNGTGGAVAFFGIAQGGADINAAFGGYLNVTATHFPGGAIGLGTDILNSSGSDMPWSAFVPGTSSAALGVDFAAGGANLNTAAVEMRNGGTQWDVGIGSYGNSIKTAMIEDDSNSATILNATGSHTNGINLGGATFSTYAFRSPGFLVTGSGGIAAVLPNAPTNYYMCYNGSNGDFEFNASTCNTSSARFKHDIRPLADTQPDPLAAVAHMNPVSFVYNEDQNTPGKYLGLIAEDLAAIDPRLVGYDKEGKPNSISYEGPMFAYMIGAIKELKAENDDLQAKVRQLSPK